jgi:dihydroxyacetone kinase
MPEVSGGAEEVGSGTTSFKDDALAGFVTAYARHVELVPGASAVMRSGGPVPGQVSVIGGGGSGHYPAFMGLVGPGLLDGAVIGEVFTSPSAEQAYRTGRALESGAGVLFSYGNYAGDRLNFDMAQERLRSEGIDCRTVVITDDIASAGPAEAHLRRGVAGDLAVYKIAGAAAQTGMPLAEVERLAQLANERTRTIGVAWGGCTLPGASEPLFSVADGLMEMGLGIHGEPGVRAMPSPSPAELATLMVESLLAERPAGSQRAAVLLNGLGGVKYEELFGLWSRIHPLLVAVGIELVAPEVGELVTSLDMRGCSLTVAWLDRELETLWLAPCDTPAFRRPPHHRLGDDRTAMPAFTAAPLMAAASTSAAAVAPAITARSDMPVSARRPEELDDVVQTAQAALEAMLVRIREAEAELGRLDAVAGDGDHGSGMVRGLTAALAAARDAAGSGQGLGSVLRNAGAAWADRAGGTSGVLWGVLLTDLGTQLSDTVRPDTPSVAAAVQHATAAIAARGGARPGDKTLLDALSPFADVLSNGASGLSLGQAWKAAASTAEKAAQETARLEARIGRARALGARGVGSPDPGAISMSLCIDAVGAVLIAQCEGEMSGSAELEPA